MHICHTDSFDAGIAVSLAAVDVGVSVRTADVAVSLRAVDVSFTEGS